MGKKTVSGLRKKIKELDSLVNVAEIISTSLDIEHVLDMIMEIGMKVMNAEGCSILLKDEEKHRLNFVAVSGKKKEELKEMFLNSGEGIAGMVAETGQPVLIGDASKHPSFSGRIDRRLQQKTSSLICVPLEIRGKVIGVMEVINKKGTSRRFNNADLLHFDALSSQSALAIERARLYHDLDELFMSTIQTLASAIDAKDPYTQGHSVRVTKFSLVISRVMKMDKKERRNVELTATLHDIGKIGIPEEILRKKEKLTDRDWERIRRHPVIGSEMLSHIRQLKDVIPGVHHHHERYDGKGYPDGLKGKKIPLFSRIISVADTFDAMTSYRPYREALSDGAALAEIERCSGFQFDPRCAEAFLSAYKKGWIIKKLAAYGLQVSLNKEKLKEINDLIKRVLGFKFD